jgi:hypothetical protein
MSNNEIFVTVVGVFILALFAFMTWVMLRGPVERMQADGTPYPKEPDWREREDFVGPLEPCFFYNSESPAGSYTIASSKIRNAEIKWFGAEFNTVEMKAWLNKFGYYHA